MTYIFSNLRPSTISATLVLRHQSHRVTFSQVLNNTRSTISRPLSISKASRWISSSLKYLNKPNNPANSRWRLCSQTQAVLKAVARICMCSCSITNSCFNSFKVRCKHYSSRTSKWRIVPCSKKLRSIRLNNVSNSFRTSCNNRRKSAEN